MSGLPFEEVGFTSTRMGGDFLRRLREQQLFRFAPKETWHPEPPPELHGERRIILNAETNGLRWWDDARAIGWAWRLPESGRSGYLPIRHRVGENLDVEAVSAWMRSLRGLHVDNINTKFDAHIGRADGIDFVELFTLGDVAQQAALLDDHRFRFNLDQLSTDFIDWDVNLDPLGKQPKMIIDESEFSFLHPTIMSPYAVRNVNQVDALERYFAPRIEDEHLDEVLALEQEVIKVVIEMEANGTYIDMELLTKWRMEARRRMEELLYKIFRVSGVKMKSPDTPTDLALLFKRRGIPIEDFTPRGVPSFTAEVMHRHSNDECIAAAYEASQLADLLSKYLDKYGKAARGDGWLRFNLHQLRTTRGDSDDEHERKAGTVSGRFSAAGDDEGGYNPQQVVAVEKQLERGWCPDFVVRRLFVPGPGRRRMGASDMDQVEYRLFACYASDPQILAEYDRDPHIDYHKTVMELLHQVNPTLNRKLVKNTNFAKLYGAGLIKFAYMIGAINSKEYLEFRRMQARKDWSYLEDPRLKPAKELNTQYDKMFPAVAPLISKASKTAEQRGYVRTILGRRARLLDRFHSAVNRIIQGGAADLNKLALVDIRKRAKKLGVLLRLTVHDEVVYDLDDDANEKDIHEALNEQRYPTRVPIFWSTKVGANWAECK